MKRLLALLLVAAAMGLALTYAADRARNPVAHQVEAGGRAGAWVRAPGPPARALFLQTVIELTSPPARAWIRVETTGGTTVYVGEDAVTNDLLWRPTRPDQNGLREFGQRLRESPPAIALNYPREYQWGEGGVKRVAQYVDLTPYLRPGSNRLSLHVESRSPGAAARVMGEVRDVSGSLLPLRSDAEWRAGVTPSGGSLQHWLRGSALDHAPALVVAGHAGSSAPLSLVAERAFSTPFAGRWMQVSGGGDVWFRRELECAEPAEQPWLRVLADHPYDLFVNGQHLLHRPARSPAHTVGEWLLATRAADDVLTRADQRDVDEIVSPFQLERHRSKPSQRAPERLAPEPLESDVETGGFDEAHLTEDDAALAERPFEAGASPPRDELEAIPREDVVSPLSLVAHDLRWSLRPGRNLVELRVAGTDRLERASRTLGIAVDGHTGTESTASWAEAGWRASRPDGEVLPISMDDPVGAAPLPRLSWSPRRGPPAGLLDLLERSLPWAGLLLVCYLVVAALERRRRGSGPVLPDVLPDVLAASLPALALALVTPLLALTFSESREAWAFARPGPWVAMIAVCLAAPLVTAVLARRQPLRDATLPAPGGWTREPHVILIALVGVLALVLRVHAIEVQPLDDDEYASTQAILAIARTGLPSYVPEGVIYTRGPLYHYLVAGFVSVFGEQVWVLRLPSALFGLLTAFLIQRVGSRVLGSGWIGLAAMLLFAVHPYCVFTGHVARFYQQQQFFSLLTVYLFIQGYVRAGPAPLRKWTVVAWLAAVLSQEISALFAVQLGLGFFLLRDRRTWRGDLPVVGYGLIAGLLIALDYACFKVLCQTRTEGIAPNVEARIGFNLIHLSNVSSLFLGYARIHLLGSLLLIPSACFALWKGSRGGIGLHFILLSGVLLSNVLITHVSLRYQYWLIPIWCLLAVHGGVVLCRSLLRASGCAGPVRRRAAVACRTIGLGALLAAFAPWRLPSSYEAALLGDCTGAMEFIAAHQRPDDRVFVTEPHSHAALLGTGRVDGYLSFPLLPDFHVLQDGELIDRNGGAPVIGSVSHLSSALEEEGRVWIAVNREKFKSRSKNMRWEYPGSRAELFLRETCMVAHETYLWTVFLWDPSEGTWRTFGDQDD